MLARAVRVRDDVGERGACDEHERRGGDSHVASHGVALAFGRSDGASAESG
jgi:hypothetical protein